jgi:hypothetical protein
LLGKCGKFIWLICFYGSGTQYLHPSCPIMNFINFTNIVYNLTARIVHDALKVQILVHNLQPVARMGELPLPYGFPFRRDAGKIVKIDALLMKKTSAPMLKPGIAAVNIEPSIQSIISLAYPKNVVLSEAAVHFLDLVNISTAYRGCVYMIRLQFIMIIKL